MDVHVFSLLFMMAVMLTMIVVSMIYGFVTVNVTAMSFRDIGAFFLSHIR